jgi:1,4-dihydroxy-2-naphthoyl-CoA hydrolase
MSDSAFLRPDGSIDLEALNRSITLASRLGIVIVEVSADRVVGTMPVEGNTQPQGLLHGGASVVLAETLGSVGALVVAPAGSFAVGVDINATHHRGVRDGEVVGVATPIHRGSTVTTWDVVISLPSGPRVCTARLTCLYRQAAKPA